MIRRRHRSERRRAGRGTDRAAPAVAHRIRQHAARSARRHDALRLREAARGRERSVRQRLPTQQASGALIEVGGDAGRRGGGARARRPGAGATRWSAARRRAPTTPTCLRTLRHALRAARAAPAAHRRGGRPLPRPVARSRVEAQRLLRRRRPGAARDAAGPRVPLSRRARQPGRRLPGRVPARTTTRSATRLSYFLWGTTPPDELLDLAAARQARHRRRTCAPRPRPCSPTRARAPASSASTRSGSATTSCRYPPELTGPMRAEIRRADRHGRLRATRPTTSSCSAPTETFVTDALADALRPAARRAARRARGCPTADEPRRGILSHGTRAVGGRKFDDTSPTLRGMFVRNRLLCQDVPPPPPNVDVDEPPPVDQQPLQGRPLRAHHRSGGCADCHNLIDPIGFGLENYDRAGAVPRPPTRTRPSARSAATASWRASATFNGPAELAELLIESGELEAASSPRSTASRWAAARATATRATHRLR